MSIKLDKDEIYKINEHAFLCYIQKWGTEEYHYVLAVNSWPSLKNLTELEVYGFGETIEEALISGVSNLVRCGLKGIPFDFFKDFTFLEIWKYLEKDEGCIASAGNLLPTFYEKNKIEGESFVIIEDGKAYPISN